LGGVNFWEWRNCREVLKPKHQIWNEIANYDWPSDNNLPKDITTKLIDALNSQDPDVVANLYSECAVHITSDRTITGTLKIRNWYSTLLQKHLPNGNFSLSNYSGSGNSRHFTWTAQSTAGRVIDGRDTLGLINDKIVHHYSRFSVS